jgi:hypothetical protein
VRIASISSVSFIVPELRGERRARAAGDHDRGHQHPELAQRQPPGEVDGVDLGPELAQLRRALLGDDDADQEAHQPDDRQRGDPDQLDLAHQRLHPEALRMADQRAERDDDRAEEAEHPHHAVAEVDHEHRR